MKGVNIIEGGFDARGLKFCIISSRFNHFVTDRLVEGALDAIVRHGGRIEDVDVVLVPGSLELPLAAKKAALSGRYDAVVALGAVIRGDTPHFEYVASQAAKGIAQTALDTGVPVIFGVITADDVQQAIERAGTKAGNKGFTAAMNAIEMANVMKKLNTRRTKKGN